MDRIASVFNRNAGLFLGLAGTDRRSPEFLNAVRAAKIDGRLVAELSQGLQRRMQLRKNRRASLDLNPTLDLWAELSGLPAGAWPERAAAVVARTVDDAAGVISNRAVREAFRGKRPASLDEARGIYEGIFRQATVVKGRNRDTAWFAVIDAEWPALREAYAAWLSPRNFDAAGRQKERLSDLTRLVRAADDPALVERLARERIPLTVCPLSNVKLCVFGTLAEHNLVQLLRAGLKVTINSDDPAYFGGYVNENFQHVFASLPLTAADAYTLLRNSLESSFQPAAEQARHVERLVCFHRYQCPDS
jgi:hypothetical protein